MNAIQRVISAVATVGLMTTASLASATVFTVSAASFAPESGYGTGNNDLDVLFSTSAFSGLTFTLNNVGESARFFFGSIDLQTTDIAQNQTGSLGVVASLTFTNPTPTQPTQPTKVNATGTATTGLVSDAAVDYKINWNPVTVNFGSGGQFQVDLDDLSFTNIGSQTQVATVTLLKLSTPTTPAAETPEPGTVALLGLGLLGFAASRRKSAKK